MPWSVFLLVLASVCFTTVFMLAFDCVMTWYWGGWQLWEKRPVREPEPEPPPPLEGGNYRSAPWSKP